MFFDPPRRALQTSHVKAFFDLIFCFSLGIMFTRGLRDFDDVSSDQLDSSLQAILLAWGLLCFNGLVSCSLIQTEDCLEVARSQMRCFCSKTVSHLSKNGCSKVCFFLPERILIGFVFSKKCS